MIENPFTNRAAIEDSEYFSNRAKETKQILEMLRKGQSVSLEGPRKIGKTSLLFHIVRPEVLKNHRIDPRTNLFVYVDCQSLVNHKLNDLYMRLLQTIADYATQYDHCISSPQNAISFYEFETALGQIFKQNLKLALLLDEFEILRGIRQIIGKKESHIW